MRKMIETKDLAVEIETETENDGIGPEDIVAISPENVVAIGLENIVATGPENVVAIGHHTKNVTSIAHTKKKRYPVNEAEVFIQGTSNKRKIKRGHFTTLILNNHFVSLK